MLSDNRSGLLKHLFACLLATLLFMLTGCRYLYPVEEEPLPPPLVQAKEIAYATHEVQLGVIERFENVSATVCSASVTYVQFEERSGYLSERNVTYNQEVKEGDILMKLDTDSIELDILRREINVAKAELTLQNVRLTGDESAIRFAQWDLQLARYDLEDVRKAYEKCIIRAPVDGKISYIAQVYEGSWVDARKVVISIVDPAKLIVEVSGDKAGIFTDDRRVTAASKYEEFEGTVVMTPKTAPPEIPPDERNFTWIELDNTDELVADGRIRLSDELRIRVVLERHEDVIVLPKNLVRNYIGRRYVLVLSDGLQTERDVAIGIETATSVEIVEGLSVGELVIER